LRHRATQEYHSLLLFAFPTVSADAAPSKQPQPTYYCMESTCPHLGAPLENAVIECNQADVEEEIEDMVVVCPWHEYDFSLSTGESSHGISACVYACQVRQGQLYIETPKPTRICDDVTSALDDSQWQLIELRPVSELAPSVSARHDVARNLHLAASQLHLTDTCSSSPSSLNADGMPKADEAKASTRILPLDPLPKTLVAWAVLILTTSEPARKVAYTRLAAQAFRSGNCQIIGGGGWVSTGDGEMQMRTWISKEEETPPERPPRRKEEVCVRPGQEGKRGRGGTEKSRIAILHSLANIEQWAIDLAWDIIARAPKLCAEFFSTKQADGADGTDDAIAEMPLQFYSDFVKVAEDEAKHFSLLNKRLEEMGSYFGALPVHHGLWDSAMQTAHSLTARLSIIHLVHEARGLDVNPTTIKKFENAADQASVETLTIIHLDEITHVSVGHR
jgi:uncharacterized ferritin-like protein (DUF455 family)/nitrite reductase/ring-hydroxylating ferredoxin subunit